jgi:spore germination cell wall hydrolase CwlJ-like protein
LRSAPFALAFGVFAVMPNSIGYQDLAALLARQPGVTERWQKHVVASSAAAVRVATFSFPNPIGTMVPPAVAYHLASLDGGGAEYASPIARQGLGTASRGPKRDDFPTVNRALKGDRLPIAVIAPPSDSGEPPPAMTETPDNAADPAASNASVMGAKTAEAPAASAPLDPELQAALAAPRLPQYDVSLSLEANPALVPVAPNMAATEAPAVAPQDPFAFKTQSLFFGDSLGAGASTLEHWQPGEEPMLVLPGAALDPDLKATASLPLNPADVAKSGETVASKGEVKAEPQRRKTPAERLGLTDKTRAKQEKCMAEAIYFESRGEQVRGQIAVAQVVLNRAFSGYYPTTICGVVYQNAGRHLACQFTFACDGIPDVVREPDMWERAKKIAKAMLDGQLWLPEVAKSTHYHAYWVRPSWVHEMKKMYRFGVHTFYRPRNWGDGAEAPSWNDTAQTAAIAAKL